MFKSLLLKGRTLCLLLCCIISSLAVTAQTRQTGKVIGGDDRLPVVGASVKIDGTNTGTLTDVNGNFTLSLTPGSVLVVSYIGYQTQRYTVRTNGAFTITLQPANSTLNEVVVTGYTTQVKKDISGSVAVVDIADAKKIPATSSEQLLQGQAAGVTVINQGAPGAPSTVFVRGINSFGNSSPLYVIDGVQYNNMSFLNPNDIESISVLKDAGSAAIYGVAGGNGVIVVTTKHGKAGKTTISYDGYYGDQQPKGGNVWNLVNPTQQSVLAFRAGDAATEALYGGPGILPVYGYHGGAAPAGTAFAAAGVTNDPAIAQYYHFDASNPGNDFLVQKFNATGTDWFHAIFKAAPEQQHTLTASGGSDKSTYLMSFNYVNQQGTLIDTYEKRYGTRVNTVFSVLNNHIRIGENLYTYYRLNNGGQPSSQQQEGGSISFSYRELPIIPVYDIAGNYGGAYDGPTGEPLGNGSNPVAVQNRTANNVARDWVIQGSAFAEADITKYFTARTQFGTNIDNNYFQTYNYNTYENFESHSSNNNATEGSQFTSNYNWTNTLRYHQVIGKNNIQLLLGYEQKAYSQRLIQGYANNFFSTDPNYIEIQNAVSPTSIVVTNTIYQPVHTESFFAKLDYAFDDKYILGASIRRDGFSAFNATNPDKQYGNFPAVSLAWRVSQEDFLKGASWLNDLKIRGSYGSAGSNANVPGNNAFTLFQSGLGASYYGINGGNNSITQGFYNSSLGNTNTTWETDKIFNIGFDASIFSHFDITAEYYTKKTSGLLFQAQLPATVGGASAPFINIGDVQNHGLDIAATYHGAVNQDFRYNITANITTYKNKITALPFGTFFTGASRDNNIVREKVGDPIGEFYGYKTTGIYQSNAAATAANAYSGAAAGAFIYQDINGDGKIDANNDRTDIGNPNPDFTYGVNLNATYKGFDFSMVLYGSHGNKDFNYVRYWTDFYSTFQGGKSLDLYNKGAIVENGVVTNPGATVPAASFAQALGSSTVSSYYVESGAFLKARVIQAGYTFNPNLLKSVGFSKLHVYLQATNPFTITKYKGLDPELVPSASVQGTSSTQSAAFGIDYGAYPNNQRQYILGVNLTF